MNYKTLFLLIFISLLTHQLFSQGMITNEIITRVFNIKYGNQSGTGFLIEHKSKSYIITAKHILGNNLAHKSNVKIQVFQDTIWKNLAGKAFFHTNPKIDVAVIESDVKISTPNQFELSSIGIVLSDEGYFLGFPYGLKMDDKSGVNSGLPIPFVKKATLSAFYEKDGTHLQFLDGHNNPGFSGGPVVFKNRTGQSKHKWNIIGVVSAYVNQENELVTPLGKLKYKENSGIVLAYSIQHIFEIIDRK